MRHGPVSPNNVLENRKKRCACSARSAGTLLARHKLNLGQSGTRAGASRGRVWPVPPFDQKIRGAYPPLTTAPKTKSISTARTKTKSISISTIKPSQFRSHTKKKVILDSNTEIRSISIPTLKLISISRHKNQVNYHHSHEKQVHSDPYTEIKSISIPHTEIKSTSTTHTKIKSISIPTLKPSCSRPAHKNRVKFPPPT